MEQSIKEALEKLEHAVLKIETLKGEPLSVWFLEREEMYHEEKDFPGADIWIGTKEDILFGCPVDDSPIENLLADLARGTEHGFLVIKTK